MTSRRSEPLAPGPGHTLSIGLMGGSFNPAHDGHLHVARMAMRALALDDVWWLVSPQNPLKPKNGMAPLDERLAAARALVAKAGEKHITVTAIEERLGTRFTIDTLRALKRLYPNVRFVWLMGADNMVQFPHWAKWREIAREMPLAVYPRAGFTLKARLSPAAQWLKPVTIDVGDAALLPQLEAPALVFLEGPTHAASATAIRATRVIKT